MADVQTTERTVLITGATSGIGLATARALAPGAGRLLVHGPEPLDAVGPVLDDLRGALGEGASVHYSGPTTADSPTSSTSPPR
jgi:NAD(P)-dependent dehydrogenase (short-subunit alcohol dehydrogenase family)